MARDDLGVLDGVGAVGQRVGFLLHGRGVAVELGYYTCGLAVDGVFSTAVSITSTGFEVYEINEGGTLWRRTNQNGSRFAYFAFK